MFQSRSQRNGQCGASRRVQLLDPRLEGAELQFRYLAPSTGQLTVVKANYTDAGTLKGQVGMYSSNGFEGRRVAK